MPRNDDEAMSIMEKMAQDMYGSNSVSNVPTLKVHDKAALEAARHAAGNI
jgi:hypothetical protein